MSILEEDKGTIDAVVGIDRRSFVGYVLAGTTLVAAADFALGSPACAASGVNGPQIPEFYDLDDFIDQTCLPTSSLVTVTVNTDGTASFALPRSENGQGIMTSTAMIIAEELELPVSKVKVTLADARPDCSSTSSPVGRRPRRRRTRPSGSPLRSPRARCWKPRRSCWAPR